MIDWAKIEKDAQARANYFARVQRGPRFLRAEAFLVARGLLQVNHPVPADAELEPGDLDFAAQHDPRMAEVVKAAHLQAKATK